MVSKIKRPAASMIDVGRKPITKRKAKAYGFISLRPATVARIRAGRIAKGDVAGTARLAGIMAAKRTCEIIPLCHPISVAHIEVNLVTKKNGVEITATVSALERTGVEMEALTAVAAAALTVYDMCKSVDRGAAITNLCLLEKSGGRSGQYVRKEP